MTQEEIIEGNKLIAEFSGAVWDKDDYGDYGFRFGKESIRPPRCIWGYCPDAMKYHSSWDWLMPVVEKINDMVIDNFGQPCFVLHPSQCFITNNDKDPLFISYVETSGSLILSAWNTVVQFIKWHNEHGK